MSSTQIITRFRVFSHCNNLGGKVWNPAIRWTEKYAVFVVLEDNQGHVGVGECWCFDRSPELLITYLRTEVAPQVIGKPVDAFEQTCRQLVSRATLTARHGLLASSLSGVDIALWDLLSRQSDQALWQHLNNDAAGTVFLYASGGLYGQDKGIPELTQEMSDLQATGFSMVKMKVGALPIESDIERVQAVLEALPRDTTLIIDGVYSYDIDQALRVYSALPAERITAFQSPLPAHDILGMAELMAAGLPVMATEAEYRVEMHQHLIEQNAVRFLQVAPVACGGLSRLQHLSDCVADTPIELSLEVSSTAIALMAAAHFAAADRQVAHVEFHTVHQVFFDQLDIVSDRLDNGTIALPETPGIGLVLPEQDVRVEHELRA